jgi:hypothetical protein
MRTLGALVPIVRALPRAHLPMKTLIFALFACAAFDVLN